MEGSLWNPLWKCVGTERWQGRLVVTERHRLTGSYRRREVDLPPVHEVSESP